MGEARAFLRPVGISLAAAWAAAAYPLARWGGPEIASAAATGCGIALANALAGCWSAVRAFDKPHAAFVKTLFGGMALRMLGVGAAFGALIAATEIHIAGLTFSLFTFYVLFQVLELRFLVAHLKGRRPEGSGGGPAGEHGPG